MKGKRRGLEFVKTLLILGLSASAIYLLSMTPLIQDSGILDLFSSRTSVSEGTKSVTLTAAAKPSRMAISDGNNRYGIQYNQSAVDEMFVRLGPLLGEALVSASEPEELPEYRWQACLQGKGIYFDFTGDIPLSALSSWLQSEGTCALTAAARRILLVEGAGDSVQLCYQSAEDDLFYSCQTSLLWSLHIAPAITGLIDNDVRFAFEDAEWVDLVQPYTLITEDSAQKIYTVSVPLTSGSNQSDMLEALDYAGRNHASVSGGELYLDGNDRLHVMANGRVSYNAAQSGKYSVASAGDAVTVAEAIEAARELAESTIGAQCGEAELYLISAVETEDGYHIRFGYRLDGSTVWLYDEGWAAEFYVKNGCVTEFTLYFRCYVSSGNEAMLLPMDRAAVMLPGLNKTNCELILQYRDRGESTVAPVWVAK